MQENAAQYIRVAGDNCPLLRGCASQIEEEDALDPDREDTDLFDTYTPSRLRREMPKAVEHKFPKVGMCRWFQFITTLRRLLVLWTRRWVLISFYLD